MAPSSSGLKLTITAIHGGAVRPAGAAPSKQVGGHLGTG